MKYLSVNFLLEIRHNSSEHVTTRPLSFCATLFVIMVIVKKPAKVPMTGLGKGRFG